MTLKEINTYIAESAVKDTLNNIQLTINYFNGSVTYTGLSKIYDVIQKEYQEWNTIKNIPDFFSSTKTFFERAFPQIEHLINPNFNDARQIENTKRDIESNISNYNNKVFSFFSPETQFLLNLFQERDIYVARGACKAIIVNSNTQNDYQCAERIGEIYAYEFLNKDSIITERKNKEKQALNKLRNEYENELSATQTNLTEHLKDANNKTNDFAQAITDLKIEKETNFDEWFKASKSGILNFEDEQRTKYVSWIQEKQKRYDTLIQSSTDKIDELEKLYTEKLSLEAPVTYWDNSAKEMNKRGTRALYGLIGLIVLSVIILASFFFNAPVDVLQKLLAGEAYGIKWMLTSITIISFLAYGMRSLNKLMFSSYHLARDAEERRKLTYVYLALKEQGAVDREDRHIILQSLFSRAETGLLKDESSPTMPSTLMHKFMTK